MLLSITGEHERTFKRPEGPQPQKRFQEREDIIMLCLEAEAMAKEMYASSSAASASRKHHHHYSHGVILPVNIGKSIRRAVQKVTSGGGGLGGSGGGGDGPSSLPSDLSSSSSPVDGAASSSTLEGDKGNDDASGERQRSNMCHYKAQLEQEVERLQKQLQEEIDLHVALANAVAHTAAPLFNSPSNLPDKAQELMRNVAELEMTVSKLEGELVSLRLQLCQERIERRLAEDNLGSSQSQMPEGTEPAPAASCCTWEEHISSLRVSKHGLDQAPTLLQPDHLSGCEDVQLTMTNRTLDRSLKVSRSSSDVDEGNKVDGSPDQTNAMRTETINLDKNFWLYPNLLSEEMVRCMRDIFICLSESSDISSKTSSSDCLHSRTSPYEQHFPSSPFTSFSDSSIMASKLRRPLTGTSHIDEVVDHVERFNPYGVHGKMNCQNIGIYALAAEVSWMSVGKSQLDYAAEALKIFRFLVEQLAKVNPAGLSGNQKLAFWINIYNALIMHAYLAYGVPKSDIKLFSLMQKASYTVGGQSISAAEIEFVILKMKPPAHRQQLALILALHKFKISEEHKKFSIDNSEPITLFALSCGMYSSPAVSIFTADNIHDELKKSMRDYIRASIGISDKGKLLVPKLLHSFAKGVVEDSLFVDWICGHLTPDQVTVVRDSTSQRKQRLLGVRSFNIIPFDSRFRYLFLPDNKMRTKDQISNVDI